MLAVVLLPYVGRTLRMGAEKQRAPAGVCNRGGGAGRHQFVLAWYQVIEQSCGRLPRMLRTIVDRWADKLLPRTCRVLRAFEPFMLCPS
ncbi:MAG TPA: hypothetical protein VHE81_19615 [Lacipirellulaceae bacterium]|nr:hypothetical protein [Lacipirellulaceae bacterium]